MTPFIIFFTTVLIPTSLVSITERIHVFVIVLFLNKKPDDVIALTVHLSQFSNWYNQNENFRGSTVVGARESALFI